MTNVTELVSDALSRSRDSALEGAVEICQEIAKVGGSAQQCVDAITYLRKGLARREQEERQR